MPMVIVDDNYYEAIKKIMTYHEKFNFEEEYITFDILVDSMTFFQ